MKTTLSWLKEYTTINVPPAELAEIFTHLGLEVESVSGAYTPREGIVIGRVLETKKHPEADRLTVNQVDVGNGKVLEIVCGAPNVRPGLLVPVVLAGNTLPSGLEIKKSKIRGVVSHGMLCSENELGLSTEAKGIMELKEGAVPGETFSEKHFDADPAFEIAVLPNRPDCLSVCGLARELNARLKGGLKLPEGHVAEGRVRAMDKVKVAIMDKAACPRYSARYISGVKVGPSPEWLVKRLASVGVRAISNVVDITNFVLMELGHPLHAFDYAKVAGGSIIVRKASEGERFTTLDNVERLLTAEDLLICDAERPVALAGVMGGANSEVSDATTEILLESAYFDPVTIRKTGKRLGLSSEASYRFERGADPAVTIQALDRAASLICELAGGTAAEGVVDNYPAPIRPLSVHLRTSRVNALLGTALTPDQVRGNLSSIGLKCGQGEDFGVVAPTNRPDLTREADLIEEVARLVGYNNIKTEARSSISLYNVPHPVGEFRESVRSLLAGMGLTEVITNSLVHPDELAAVKAVGEPVKLKNPMSPEMSVLRTSMLSSLLNVVKWNQNRSNMDLALFEMGRVYEGTGAATLPDEKEMVAAIFTGRAAPVRWDGRNEAFDLYAIRGLLDAFSGKISGGRDESDIAAIQVPGGVLKHFDVKGPVFYFEVSLERLAGLRRGAAKYRPLSKFPPADRDMALVVDAASNVTEMAATIRKEGGFIESVSVFDVFQGKGLPEGKKSVAFSIRMRKADNTLTDKEIDETFSRVLKRLETKYLATLR